MENLKNFIEQELEEVTERSISGGDINDTYYYLGIITTLNKILAQIDKQLNSYE